MDIAVHRAQLVREAAGDVWHLTCEVTYDDGTVEPVGWTVPADTVMWRMGEYDLDPTDIDGALELIMFEFYLPPDQATEILTAADLPAARRQHRQNVKARKGKGKLRGVKRAADKIAAVTEPVGGVVQVQAPADGDPLDTIRANTTVTAEHVAVIREHTDNRRRRIREQRAQARAAADARASESAEDLRARLNPPAMPEKAPTVQAMPDQQAAAIVQRMLDKRKALIREQQAAEQAAKRRKARRAAERSSDDEMHRQQAEQASRVASRREQRDRDAAAEAARRNAAAAELAAAQSSAEQPRDQDG